MNGLIWMFVIIMFFYTMGFSITLWKEKNKTGSFGIFLLAAIIVIAANISVLK